MKPLVSAVVINYNYGRYLAEAVESVLAQDLPSGRLEVIVVDDGSTDDSAERIKPYLDRVRWLPKRNGGQVSAFNAGFAAASGEFVALLEADDTWEKDKLRKTLEQFRIEPRAALVQHWLRQVDAGGRPLPGYHYPDGPTRRASVTDIVRGRLATAGSSSVVFRADALRSFLPFPEEFLFGADICLRLIAALSGPVVVVCETLGSRRIHGANLFGATLYDDPVKLGKTLKFYRPQWDYLRALLARGGSPIDAETNRELDAEYFQMKLFYHRYRGEWGAALGAWASLVRLCGPRPYGAFKALSLLLALASPKRFLSAQQAYASSTLMSWRRRWLPV
jgi:glycosyltransferase involved in cell wall biosynthesis